MMASWKSMERNRKASRSITWSKVLADMCAEAEAKGLPQWESALTKMFDGLTLSNEDVAGVEWRRWYLHSEILINPTEKRVIYLPWEGKPLSSYPPGFKHWSSFVDTLGD